MTGKKQVEVLMNELLGFAKKMLSEYGEFHPFGGYLRPSGSVVHVGVNSDVDDGDSQREMEFLVRGLKDLVVDGGPIGFGTVADVSLPSSSGEKRDAIKFFLEHEDGYCAEVFFNYKLTSGEVVILDVTAQQGESVFFAGRP